MKKKIYLFVKSTAQGVQTKFLKLSFLIEFFFHLPTKPVVHLELRRKYLKKFETAPMGYLGDWGKLIHGKKTRSRKSLGTVF